MRGAMHHYVCPMRASARARGDREGSPRECMVSGAGQGVAGFSRSGQGVAGFSRSGQGVWSAVGLGRVCGVQ